MVPEAMPYHSRCHAFSCAPLYFMQSVILGVCPTQPGFSEFTLAPQPGNLSEAQGAIPTPVGLIHVNWRRNGIKLSIELTVPYGLTAHTQAGEFSAGKHKFEI